MPRDLVFICFSRKDCDATDYRSLFQSQFNAITLARGHEIQIQYYVDEQIRPGTDWQDDISVALSRTRIALVLEGPGLAASDFIQNIELKSFLAAVEADEHIALFRVPVRHMSQYALPGDLTKLQAVHPIETPLAALSETERDKSVATIVDKVVERYLEIGNDAAE